MPTKTCLVKAMVFPVVMYGCESWTAEKAECWRVDAFELWCWGILLRVPWTSRRSSQSILKEISPEYSLKDWGWSRSSNTLVTWCEELTYWKRPLCWEGLKAGREGDDRGWDGWMASPTLWTWIWVNSRYFSRQLTAGLEPPILSSLLWIVVSRQVPFSKPFRCCLDLSCTCTL